MNKCVLCGGPLENEWGNNPWPLCSPTKGSCCDRCNKSLVIPARVQNWQTTPYEVNKDKNK